MNTLRYLIWISLFLSLSVLLGGCDLFGLLDSDDSPEVNEVVVVGTQVGSDFQQNGEFGLSATPLDPDSSAILSEDIDAEVTIEHPDQSGSAATVEGHIDAIVELEDSNEPSESALAASLTFDASGSLDDYDEPERHRVEGGKAFIDVLEESDAEYETAVFEYSGSCVPDPSNFQCADLLHEFTDDPAQLKSSIEQVGSSGGTPTYGSLLEILEYSENERPTADYEKIILLFSDGYPNDTNLQERREMMCEEASPSQKDSPVFAIGLGPGSNLNDEFIDPEAVEEMNHIANCTNGTYNGIDPAAPRQSALENFSAVGTASSKGFVEFTVTITSGLEDFETGDIVNGTLSVSSGGESAEGSFSFRVPAEDMSTGAFHYSE